MRIKIEWTILNRCFICMEIDSISVYRNLKKASQVIGSISVQTWMKFGRKWIVFKDYRLMLFKRYRFAKRIIGKLFWFCYLLFMWFFWNHIRSVWKISFQKNYEILLYEYCLLTDKFLLSFSNISGLNLVSGW